MRALVEVATSLHPHGRRAKDVGRSSGKGKLQRYKLVPIGPAASAASAASAAPEKSTSPASDVTRTNDAFNNAPANFKEAALGLVQLASTMPEIALSSDTVKELVGSMIVSYYSVLPLL